MRIIRLLDKLLIPSTIISTLVYITWRAFFTLPFGYGFISVTLGLLLIAVEIIGMLEAAIHFYAMSDIKSPKRPDVDKNSVFPDVDVFIATYNEPCELLYKTVNGCLHMDYPDKSKVHIYICDDGRRDSVAELAEKMGVGYIKRADNTHAKAGNLNNALSVTLSPLIVTFDADMIPMSDFLTACIPYFMTDEKIGFLQTPQAFYNMDLYQYYLYSEDRVPNEQDYFYKTVQVSRNKLNTVIYGGSNTVISRKALEETGGFVTDVITEDFATGMAIQSNGYKCLAIADVHASGLSPEDLKSLIKQRERWARGCIQSGRKLKILTRRGLSFKQKISYLSSIAYWYSSFKRIVYLISPVAFALFGIVVVNCTVAELIVFWLPMYALNRISIGRLSNNIRSARWSNVYDTIMFAALMPVVLIEQLGMTKTKFAVTRKDGVIEYDNAYRMKMLAPHLIMSVAIVLGMASVLWDMFVTGSMRPLYILFWLTINLYYSLMAVFFMLGRDGYPESKTATAAIKCAVRAGNVTFECVTDTISEEEITITTDTPVYFGKSPEIRATLETDKYRADLNVELSGVFSENGRFTYKFAIIKEGGLSDPSYLQIIYDRTPTTVKRLEPHNSAFDDLRVNIVRRLYKKKTERVFSALPEIAVNKEYTAVDGEGAAHKVLLSSFSFERVVIKPPENVFCMKLDVETDNGVVLKCEYERILGKGKVLYEVMNINELTRTKELDGNVAAWLTHSARAETLAYNQFERKTAEDYEFDELQYI